MKLLTLKNIFRELVFKSRYSTQLLVTLCFPSSLSVLGILGRWKGWVVVQGSLTTCSTPTHPMFNGNTHDTTLGYEVSTTSNLL